MLSRWKRDIRKSIKVSASAGLPAWPTDQAFAHQPDVCYVISIKEHASQKHPLSEQEQARLDALGSFALLDTPPEPAYDLITQLASSICNVPIALMTLVDADRQWFKSRIGLDVSETPRAHSFCAYTMLEESLTIVEDTLNDPRFAQSPLVRGEPRIRFYAGAPLISPEGYGLGSLCVIDREPRKLTTHQTQALAILARTVMALLESRRSNTQLAEARAMIKTLSNLLPICADCGVTRTDDAYWDKVKNLVRQHGNAKDVASLCTDCAKIHAAHS